MNPFEFQNTEKKPEPKMDVVNVDSENNNSELIEESQIEQNQTPVSLKPKNNVEFIKKTYLHLLLGLGIFSLSSAILQFTPLPKIMLALYATGWLAFIILLLFGIFSAVLHSAMETLVNKKAQYAALTGYAIAESVVFAPMIMLALLANVLVPAIIITAVAFGILTAIALVTKKDFSFLKSFLFVALIVGLLTIVLSLVFKFYLAIWFSALMILVACGFILYDTSKIIHNYREEQYIAASAALLASLLLLFWYVVRFLLQLISILSD